MYVIKIYKTDPTQTCQISQPSSKKHLKKKRQKSTAAAPEFIPAKCNAQTQTIIQSAFSGQQLEQSLSQTEEHLPKPNGSGLAMQITNPLPRFVRVVLFYFFIFSETFGWNISKFVIFMKTKIKFFWNPIYLQTEDNTFIWDRLDFRTQSIEHFIPIVLITSRSPQILRLCPCRGGSVENVIMIFPRKKKQQAGVCTSAHKRSGDKCLNTIRDRWKKRQGWCNFRGASTHELGLGASESKSEFYEV